MKFEWGENKNQTNNRKHGIDFHDAAYVFSDPFKPAAALFFWSYLRV